MTRPNHHMQVTDLPRDKGALGGLKRALCASFNYCRKYPKKMTVLKETIVFVHGKIVEWENAQVTVEAPVAEEE